MNLPLNNLAASPVIPASAPASARPGDDDQGADAGKMDFSQHLANAIPNQGDAKNCRKAMPAPPAQKMTNDAVIDPAALLPALATVAATGPAMGTSSLAKTSEAESSGNNVKPHGDKDPSADAGLTAGTLITANLMPVLPQENIQALHQISVPANRSATAPGQVTGSSSAAMDSTLAANQQVAAAAIAASLPAKNAPVSSADAEAKEIGSAQQTRDPGSPLSERLNMVPAAVSSPLAVNLPPAQTEITTSLQNPHWDQQLGQRVIWLSTQEHQSAEIRITPPELGPIQLQLTLDGNQSAQSATLHFASPHPEVREAIQNAMPQLRISLADAGITLGNTTVGSESFRQQGRNPDPGSTGNFASQNELQVASVNSAAIATRRGNALLDTFA